MQVALLHVAGWGRQDCRIWNRGSGRSAQQFSSSAAWTVATVRPPLSVPFRGESWEEAQAPEGPTLVKDAQSTQKSVRQDS